MKPTYKYIILLYILKLINSLQFMNQSNIVEDELKKYFQKVASCRRTKYSSCYYSGLQSDVSRDLGNWLINKENSFLISNSNDINGKEYVYKFHKFFVFMESIDKMSVIVGKLTENSFWSPNAHNYFIITTEVKEDPTVVSAALQHIWSKNILNFVLVFVKKNKLQAYTYHPFEQKKVINIRDKRPFCKNQFPDKMKNFHGHPLRATVHEIAPNVIRENGVWKGRDIAKYYLIVDMLNASRKIIARRDANQSVHDLQLNKADILFVKKFQVPYFDNISQSYPHGMGDKIVTVPTPSEIPSYRHIFYIFDSKIWILLLLLVILQTLLYAYIDFKNKSFSNSFMLIWATLLSLSITNSLLRTTKKKWLLMIWIYACLVFSAAFQTSLTSSLVKPIYEKSIKTISDLRESQMKIYINPFFMDLIPERFGLSKQYVPMILSKQRELLENKDTSGAHAVSRDIAEDYINKMKKRYGEPIYEIVQEALIPGTSIYVLQKNSPILEKFNDCLLLVKQHGLINQEKYYIANNSEEKHILKMSNLLIIFYILFIGYILSFVVFLLEVFSKKKKNSK